MTRTRWAILATVLILLYGLGYLLMFDKPIPYTRPPVRTQEDQRKVAEAVKKAERDRIGPYVIVDAANGIYFRLSDGGKRWVVRRS